MLKGDDIEERLVETVARGLRAPIINEGDSIVDFVVDSVMKAQEVEGFEINDRDIISITESIIARGQGNYATVDNIAKDVSSKFGDDRSEEHMSELQSRGY